jgi:hypothetical protein
MNHEKSRVISANDLHVITTQFLDAARQIHVAMCLFSDDHAAQANLNDAMHSALIGAGVCRQIHASEKRKFMTASTTHEHEEGDRT